MDIIAILDEYGCNREYAIKCVELNKHNSITSTYYLLLKHEKREYIQEMEKQGKRFDDIVKNEKEQLLNLLKGFGKEKPKAIEKNKPVVQKKNAPVQCEVNTSQESMSGKMKKPQLKPIKIPDDLIESSAHDVKSKTSNFSDSKVKRHQSVDSVSKNNKTSHKIHRTKNKPVQDDQEGSIIISGRQSRQKDPKASPSPTKYDIAPNKESNSEIASKAVKRGNYNSAMNKKAVRYDYSFQKHNSSLEQKPIGSRQGKSDSKTKFNSKRTAKDYLAKTQTQTHKVVKLKQESRENRNIQQLKIDYNSKEPHNFAVLSKSVDSKAKKAPEIEKVYRTAK